MSTEVDIKQLAIARDERPATQSVRRRHIVSRYVVPGALVAGFLAIIAWASRDAIWPPRPVSVVPVLATSSAAQSEGTPLFQAAGWIEPRPTPIRVAALAPGVVEKLLVVEDQAVKAGEPIAELVKQDAQLACERAEADLKLRDADVAEKEAGLKAATTRLEQPVHLQAALSEAESTLAAIETELKNLPFETKRAEAQLEFATGDYERKQNASDAVSGREIQQAKSGQEAAQALVDELRGRADSLAKQQEALVSRRDALATQLKLLTDETRMKEEHVAKCAAAEARLEQTRVDLKEAKLRLDRMTIKAPMDGRVYQLVAYPGTTLSGGMGPVPNADGSTVVTMYRPDMLQVRVDVRFEDIPKVSLGQPVLVNNPALSEPIRGKVLFVSSKANIQKNTLEVKVALDSPVAVFKPDMLVNVTHLAPKPAAEVASASAAMRVYVPQQLVMHDDAGSFVWVADQSNRAARKTSVTTGAAGNAGLVEVTLGLEPGSRIISRGYETLGDGDRIRIVDEDGNQTAGAVAAAHSSSDLHRLPQGE